MRCDQCKYWIRHSDDRHLDIGADEAAGDCRRYPPQIEPVFFLYQVSGLCELNHERSHEAHSHTAQQRLAADCFKSPITTPDHFCGEFHRNTE